MSSDVGGDSELWHRDADELTSSSSFFLWAGRGSERWAGGAEDGEQLDEGQSLSDRSRAV